MKIINKILIDDYQQKHADSVKPLENWKELVKLAKWHTPQDIRNAIRSADFLSGNRVIFNIGGNNHRATFNKSVKGRGGRRFCGRDFAPALFFYPVILCFYPVIPAFCNDRGSGFSCFLR